MFWQSSNVTTECCVGEACAETLSHEWQGLAGVAKRGVAVVDVTSLVEKTHGAGAGAVVIEVEACATVDQGSQARDCSGVLSTFVLAVPKGAVGEGQIPAGFVSNFPLAFGDCKGRVAFRLPKLVKGTPCIAVVCDRAAISCGHIRSWSCKAVVPDKEREQMVEKRWVVCVVYSLEGCASASFDMRPSVEVCGGGV
jgi:hypothetical protein